MTQWRRAIQIMTELPKSANDMMTVSRLQGFGVSRSTTHTSVSRKLTSHSHGFRCRLQGKLTAQGKLLHHGTLSCFEHSSRGAPKPSDVRAEDRRVFLFEQIVIFSREVERRNHLTPPSFTFRTSLKVRAPTRIFHPPPATVTPAHLLTPVVGLQVNNMALQESVTGFDALHFQLIDRTPRSDLRILCHAGSDDEKATWMQHINAQLRQQQNLLEGECRDVTTALSNAHCCNDVCICTCMCPFTALQSPIQHGQNKTNAPFPEFHSKLPQSKLPIKQTQSHPAKVGLSTDKKGGAPHADTVDAMTAAGASAAGGSSKHTRTKSIPSSLQHTVTSSAGAPNSRAGAAVQQQQALQERNSPKPKRNFFDGFKNPLRSKKHANHEPQHQSPPKYLMTG